MILPASKFCVRESVSVDEPEKGIPEQIRIPAVVVPERHLVEARGQVTGARARYQP